MSGQHTPGPTIAQMRARMNSGHRQVLEAARDGRKLTAIRIGDARGLITCRATLIGWGAIDGERLTGTGRDLLAAIAPTAEHKPNRCPHCGDWLGEHDQDCIKFGRGAA
ncbi:hypothetical protein [Variovorax sp.]|jgi:hypothetical protein|uniref:hypothetical protein n=1 Tax=Variovorax sp. TaxID=1871043 RepID=UPI0040384D2B